MNTLELIEVGDAVGLILPEDLLRRLKVAEGDTLYLTETADGFSLTIDDPQSEPQAVSNPTALKVSGAEQRQNKK